MRVLDKYTMDSEAAAFYSEAIELLAQSKKPFLIGGGIAMVQHTKMERCSKDLDIFVKPSDYMQLLQLFAEQGFEVQVYDVRWLAKIFKGSYYIDLIFSSVSNICRVDDHWFKRAVKGKFGHHDVLYLSAEDLIWCKSYIWNRERFDGADINHLLLTVGEQLNWKYVLERLDPHWHLLLAELLMFQFIYPNDYRRIIPEWLFDELMVRAQQQYQLPPPVQKVCRGPLIDNTQYSIDIKQLDYKSCTIMTI